MLEFLPTWAPELNPIECIFGHLKHHELPDLCTKHPWELSWHPRRALRHMRQRPTWFERSGPRLDGSNERHYLMCFSRGLPPHQKTPGGETSAKASHQDEITRPYTIVSDRFRQADRYGSRRRVGIAVDVNHQLRAAELQLFRGRVDDTDVGLMGDIDLEVSLGVAVPPRISFETSTIPLTAYLNTLRPS